MKRILVVAGLALSACGVGASGTCSTDSTLTWESFGQSFMTANCTSCHGTTSASDGVSLTSAALVRAHLNKVDSEVASGAMPPRGSTSLTTQQKTDLANWLACGAP